MPLALRKAGSEVYYCDPREKNQASGMGDLALDSGRADGYNTPCAAEKRHTKTLYGGVAQLARAFGSYPECHLFESDRRYQKRTVILIESYRSFSLPKKPITRAFFAFRGREISHCESLSKRQMRLFECLIDKKRRLLLQLSLNYWVIVEL